MKNKLKNSNGVTLIAIVVTVIILIILAGVSIAILTGENGLISKLQLAKKEMKYAQAEEKMKLAVLASYTENGLEKELLVQEINKIGNIKKEEWNMEVVVDDYEFAIKQNGMMSSDKNPIIDPTEPSNPKDELEETRELTPSTYFLWSETEENTILGLSEEGEEKYENGELTELVFPADLKGISGDAFLNRTEITGLILIPNGCSIGDEAFLGCKGITTVQIGEGANIGGEVFANCNKLLSFKIGKESAIGYNICGRCTNLLTVKIGDAVTIGDEAFSKCTNLANLEIGNGVTIGDGAFSGCTGLTTLEIEEEVTIRDSAFLKCTGLKNIVIGNNTTIGESSFSGCKEIERIYIKSGCSIMDGAFTGAKATEVLIEGDIINIGDEFNLPGNTIYVKEGININGISVDFDQSYFK